MKKIPSFIFVIIINVIVIALLSTLLNEYVEKSKIITFIILFCSMCIFFQILTIIICFKLNLSTNLINSKSSLIYLSSMFFSKYASNPSILVFLWSIINGFTLGVLGYTALKEEIRGY